MTAAPHARRPNVLFLLADQWRGQAFGFAGDPNVQTPTLDRLARESIRFTAALSPCPACTPARAALLTGRSAFSTGMFLNDARLDPSLPSLGKVFAEHGYDTGWIGKWHVDGHGRTAPVPPERQHGFQPFWRGCECTHDYENSVYFADGETKPRRWPGYDAFTQTDCAIDFLSTRAASEKPFALFVSWGPPHDPYATAPGEFQARYDPAALQLAPNVPDSAAAKTRTDLRGYYGHCSALDRCVERLLAALAAQGLAETTWVVFTSDHGDLVGSHGLVGKQAPYEESIRVPLLLRAPTRLALAPRVITTPFALPDLMPTLLGVCGLTSPPTVESLDWSSTVLHHAPAPRSAVLLHHLAVYGNWTAALGAREYRGLRTADYLYVRDRSGPWLLFDLERDPYELENRIDDPHLGSVAIELDLKLQAELAKIGDPFARGEYYHRRWGYEVDSGGNIVRFSLPAGQCRA